MTDIAETVKRIREHLPPEATQEEWKYIEGPQCYPFVATEGDIVCVPDPNHGVPDAMDQRNFKYIVAVQPKFMRAILAELERVTGERDEWILRGEAVAEVMGKRITSLERELAEAKAKARTPGTVEVCENFRHYLCGEHASSTGVCLAPTMNCQRQRAHSPAAKEAGNE